MSRAAFLLLIGLSGFLNFVMASEPPALSFRQTVGPPIVFTPPRAQPVTDPTGRLIVVNWNVHVGHGDIEGLIKRISAAEAANGFGKPEFVLLLEESFRRSADIPAATGSRVPSRIAPPHPDFDIQDLAQKLEWWLYYAPSMRNGNATGQRAEDRGNAILSSLPLENVTAVELPFEVQRRVALVATVTDVQKAPKLRVAVAHFDTRAPLRRGWIFGGPAARATQARGFVASLENLTTDRLPLIVGGDLNTALGSKGVTDTLSAVAPHHDCGNRPTHNWGLTLDHIFARIPETWTANCVRGDSAFGSDHFPLVLSLRVAW